MDKSQVKAIIDGLKSTSSNRIQDSLLKIKSCLITTSEGIKLFTDCGGLNYLVPHLRKPNERILDITLSILGNVCLDEKCSIEVGKLNTFAPLVSILNTVCRDSILGRTCKLIGNLAQNKSNAEGLHNHGVVKAIVTLIEGRDKTTSNPTLTMAVRAIRQLWMITEKRDEMLSLNVVRCIAILLTTECESVGLMKSTTLDKEIEEPRRSQEELIIGILKCLGYFTTYSIPQCAEQLQGDGRGYQCLVALTKRNENLALKCLMNLCYQSICRPLLGTAGLIECLVNILKKHKDVSWWPEGSIKALAQLSGESVNRLRLRHCGGLPLLVTAARVDNNALHALLQYVFDDTAFQIMISEGLINLLTEKLITYVSSMDIEHNFNVEASVSETKKAKTNKDSGENLNKEKCNKNKVNEASDEFKVVIERDNMIVGFVDAIGSDRSDDSDDDGTNPSASPSLKRKGMKRGRASPKYFKKKPKLIKMANKDWSAGVYWEPKSPEPVSPNFPRMRSPDRSDFSPLSQYSDGNWSGLSPEYASCSSRRGGWDWSPGSGSSDSGSTSPYRTDFPWSPSSSSPASPLSAEDSSDSEVSGRYSPVCSEGEDETDGNKPQSMKSSIDPAQVAHELEELIMEDDESSDESPSEECSKQITMTKTSGVMCVLVLLFRVSHGTSVNTSDSRDEPSNSVELLTGQDCMNALLDYVERSRRPTGRAARIIARVLSNSLCLISILKHRFVMRLHTMSVKSKHSPTKCRQCKQLLKLGRKLLEQLTIVAESSHGIGEISYNLLKGSPNMKQTLSITLPYIVRTGKVLKKYFIDCDALNLLFSIVSESKENIQNCVTALAKLAENVQIKDPKLLETRYKGHIPVTYDPILDNLPSEDIVTFILDDQSTVQASKHFLCQHSDVFSVMLTGSFKESNEKNITLRKATKQALEYLFTLIQCGLNDTMSEVEVFPLNENLETNLEVLLLADRFLFDNIKCLLSSAIIQFQLTPENADKIYVWSLVDGMGFLCVEAVAYVLTGQMEENLRIMSFKNILELEYKDQWLEDIKAMILRQLIKRD